MSLRRSCPFCDQSQLWMHEAHGSVTGVYIHEATNLRHCDEERLAHWDTSKIRRELNQ